MNPPETHRVRDVEPDENHAVDREMGDIVNEEERVLGRVLRTVENRVTVQRGQLIDYDAELIALRDQIRDARIEDIPPLIEEMERLQQVANRRAKVTQGVVDRNSPYFGRMVLEEGERKREVLIGRSTFLDSKTGVRIVDWRDAPISRVYYRYEEGDDYDEVFGDRDVEGEVLVRRNLSISMGKLRRIGSPQGTFKRTRDSWRRVADSSTKLTGGQGVAMRPESHHRPGQLGVGEDDGREDKHLAEITALIDPTQFELITKPTSGLVVVQGGAGSGKTTIGLHRLAYLAFQEASRVRSDSRLVVVFNDALVRYISHVLPALGVENVSVVTFEDWASRARLRHFPHLPKPYNDETPGHVTRLKKHPVMLRLIDTHAEAIASKADAAIKELASKTEGGAHVTRAWRSTEGSAPGARLRALRSWLNDSESTATSLTLSARHTIERTAQQHLDVCEDIVGAWAELLTDRGKLKNALDKWAPGVLTDREIGWAHAWCTKQCTGMLNAQEAARERDREGTEREPEPRDPDATEEPPTLDREDDALLLRMHQRLSGMLRRRRSVLQYEHIFVDEAQDMSPVELSVVLDTSTEQQSVTLAGDVAQKLHMDNGFSDWKQVLEELGLDHVSIEPLRLAYRSTHEILEFATSVLGPLKNEVSGKATRHGAPVELFRFGDSGAAVGFLSEALRNLVSAEPLASVAVIARYPEQADLYYKGLTHGEVPNLRRIAEQDFPFRPGVDVTDVRQVKGLEFDYVVIVECTSASFPEDDEARHLLHIGATRAAHQLWAFSTGTPSVLVPESLRGQSE